jgi:hypothetical protein
MKGDMVKSKPDDLGVGKEYQKGWWTKRVLTGKGASPFSAPLPSP